jgi:seryl-tRNA synthetase
LENYQTEEGVIVPEVLRNYMGGKEFIPWKEDKKPKKTVDVDEKVADLKV